MFVRITGSDLQDRCEFVRCRFVLPDFNVEICTYIILCFYEGLIHELTDNLILARNRYVTDFIVGFGHLRVIQL